MNTQSILKNFVIPACAFMMLVAPVILFAATAGIDIDKGLVHCVGVADQSIEDNVPVCHFNELIGAVKHLINWMIVVAIPIVVCVFSYAGVLFMTAKESNITKAKSIFGKVALGFALMLGAWLIVHTIITLLVDPKAGGTLFFAK